MTIEKLTLRTSSRLPEIDRLLIGIISLYELTFPGRISSYLLLGSYSDGSAVAESDLDICMIFKPAVVKEERDRFGQLMHACQMLCAIRLDVSLIEEERLARGVSVALKDALLLYGVDLSPEWPLQPLAQKIRHSMLGALHYMFVLRGKDPNLFYPLNYPDSEGEFYGYERYGGFSGGSIFTPGIRLIVSELTLIATTLVALQTGEQIGSKSRSIEAYQRSIGDEWSGWLVDLYATFKTRWHYSIPMDADERVQLRTLCQRILPFENYFLGLCRPLVFAGLHSGIEEERVAAEMSLTRVNVITGYTV